MSPSKKATVTDGWELDVVRLEGRRSPALVARKTGNELKVLAFFQSIEAMETFLAMGGLQPSAVPLPFGDTDG